MSKQVSFIRILILNMIFLAYVNVDAIMHYYATSADANFFNQVVNLIKTIQTNDLGNPVQIAVFDLGFTVNQRFYLSQMNSVTVYDLELKHPDLLKYFVTSPNGRRVRGWFAWKPVAIKQALDLFPYVLYLDAGMEVLGSLDLLFLHISQNGYFLIDSGDSVQQTLSYRVTRNVINKIINKLDSSKQSELLGVNTRIISAGIQGLSRAIFQNYLLPVYNWVDDLDVFMDDGTAKLGFGQGRHDQIVFSIYANLNNFYINQAGWQKLLVNGEPQKLHMHWNRKELTRDSVIKY